MQKTAVLAGALFIVGTGLAKAGLEVCNQTDVRHSVSIGYKDGDNWTSEGWWNIDPGSCSTVIDADLDLGYYYYHPSAQGHDYGGEYSFCVDQNAYTIVGDTDCAARGYTKERFLEAATGSDQTYTIVLEGAPVAASPAPVPAPTPAPSPAPAPTPALFPEGGGSYRYAGHDTGLTPGRYGEPYSIEARFAGCEAAEGDFICFFQTPAWEWVVYQDEATPIDLFTSLEVLSRGQRIRLQGDLRSQSQFVVDATIRSFQAITERTAMDALWEVLQGTFVSADDPSNELTLGSNRYSEWNSGSYSTGGTFFLADGCPPELGPSDGGPVLVKMDPEYQEMSCYFIHNANPRGFSMTLSGYWQEQTWRKTN